MNEDGDAASLPGCIVTDGAVAKMAFEAAGDAINAPSIIKCMVALKNTSVIIGVTIVGDSSTIVCFIV